MNVYDLHAVIWHKSTEYSGIFVTKDTFIFIYSTGAQSNEHTIQNEYSSLYASTWFTLHKEKIDKKTGNALRRREILKLITMTHRLLIKTHLSMVQPEYELFMHQTDDTYHTYIALMSDGKYRIRQKRRLQ